MPHEAPLLILLAAPMLVVCIGYWIGSIMED
jgi:hypothetical protein